MQERRLEYKDYRFGYNTQERRDEIAGTGNHNTAEFWEYSPRVARRWNVDPVIKEFERSYAAFGGNPIIYVDIKGDDPPCWRTNPFACHLDHLNMYAVNLIRIGLFLSFFCCPKLPL